MASLFNNYQEIIYPKKTKVYKEVFEIKYLPEYRSYCKYGMYLNLKCVKLKWLVDLFNSSGKGSLDRCYEHSKRPLYFFLEMIKGTTFWYNFGLIFFLYSHSKKKIKKNSEAITSYVAFFLFGIFFYK
jgi:hypothetical protein